MAIRDLRNLSQALRIFLALEALLLLLCLWSELLQLDMLERIAKGDTAELDPQVAAVLQKNLQVVDRAINESRAALKSQPASATAQDGLFEAMRAKVALLQQTVELINEMRKGNQAEAGRLMQDLSR